MLWGVCVTLLIAIGALWALGRVGPDPTAIKAELEMRLEELNKIPPEEAMRRDALAHQLLAEESYQEHAKALRLKLERIHRPIHDLAMLEQAALKEVPAFLARSKDVSKVNRADLELLIGEARVHVNNYGTTRFGDPLRKRLAELTARLESMLKSMPKPVTAPDVVELNHKSKAALRTGRFSDALDLIEEFLKRPGAQEYLKQIDPSAEKVKKDAATAFVGIRDNIRGLIDRSDPDAARQLLDRAESDFRRFPTELAEFATLRRRLKPQ